MKIRFLGTGTSQGVPVIGCDCEVCQSTDPRDKRLRTSAMVSDNNINLVIDVGPDFRQQMLLAGVRDIESVLITHEHNDHVIGMDDLRPFNFLSRKNMQVFCTERVMKSLRDRFAYAFAENPYPGAPRFELQAIQSGKSFKVKEIEVLPFQVMHASMPVMGFRFGDLTYITDAKLISEEAAGMIKGSKVLILNALRNKPHHSHLNLEEALEFIKGVQPKQVYLTHISHQLGLIEDVNKRLPQNVTLAYDGLEVEV